MKNIIFLLTVLSLVACSKGGMEHDAMGTFEATEIIVSAEQTGKLMYFDAEEGVKLAKGEQVGLIDTVQLQLRAMRLGATKEVYASQRPDINKQLAVTKQQLEKAELEVKRYSALVRDNAANRKQLDDAESGVRDVWFESAARAQTDPAFAYVLDTIRSAINVCQPFKMLPENEFDKWEKIQLTFYPTQGKVM